MNEPDSFSWRWIASSFQWPCYNLLAYSYAPRGNSESFAAHPGASHSIVTQICLRQHELSGVKAAAGAHHGSPLNVEAAVQWHCKAHSAFPLCRWEPQSNGTPGLMSLHLRAMDAIDAAAPGIIYLIEVSFQKYLRRAPPCCWLHDHSRLRSSAQGCRILNTTTCGSTPCRWQFCCSELSMRGIALLQAPVNKRWTSSGAMASRWTRRYCGRSAAAALLNFHLLFQGDGHQALSTIWRDGFASNTALLPTLCSLRSSESQVSLAQLFA